MSYCDHWESPGSVTEIHFGHPYAVEADDPPAITDGCRMSVVAERDGWRLLRGPLGGYYADHRDRHGWFYLNAMREADAIREFDAMVGRGVA